MECPNKYFHDTVTDNCAPCRDICLNAAMQGTEKDCQLKCPDWGDQPPDPLGSEQDMVKWIAVSLAVVIFVIAALLWIYRRELRQWLTNCAQHGDEDPDAGTALNEMHGNGNNGRVMESTAQDTVLDQPHSDLDTNCNVVPSGQ